MKTKLISSFAGVALALSSYSQLKIFPNGSVTIGATTSPTVNGVMHQIIGGKTVFTNTTTAVSSAPVIVGQNVLSSSPGYAFLGDLQTGIAHPASNALAVTVANSEKFRFNSSNQMLAVNTTSSASTPDYSWNGDPNTGIFHPANDVLGFSVNGGEKFRINSSGQLLVNVTGGPTFPDYSWKGDENTGMYQIGQDAISFSTGGSDRLAINSNGQILSMTAPNSAGNPDYSWGSDGNTGIFHPTAGVLAFSTNALERARFTSTGNLLVGTTTDNTNRLQVTGSSNQSALLNTVNHTGDYNWCQINQVNRNLTKAYSVFNSASGTNTETFIVYGSGDVWAKTGTWYSDKNLKDNIDTINGALNKIRRLKGVTYNFKASFVGEEDAAKKEIGLIAQDVEKVLPEVVRTNDKGIKGIAYQNIIPLLIEAIKEQDKQISDLKDELNSCCNKKSTERSMSSGKEPYSFSNEVYAGASYIIQNNPNPFNRETTINYFVAEKSADASILVFDMNGKLLKTFKLNSGGNGVVSISASDFQPGMYYYSLIINAKEVGTKKMVLTE